MGGQFSRKAASELRSYEAACKLDPELQTFDAALQVRTSRAINTITVGVEVRVLSFDSLREVTECLLEMNQEVVKVILDCKEDIWKTKQVFELVEEYFDNSLQTLDFCTTLEKCLKNARDRQLIIRVALQQFEAEECVGGSKYLKTLDELKSFKAAGDPFSDDFFKALKAVYGQHVLMLEKLQLRRSKLDTKIKCIRTWRKVSCVIFAAAFASVLICSIVAAVIATPGVAGALAAATSIPIGSMGKWFDSFWKNCEASLKGQKEIISSMQAGTYLAIKDLDSIRVLVDRLEMEIESLLHAADFALKGEEAVKIGIEEIKKNLASFMQSIEDLGEHADKCSRDVTRARTVVLQRISKQPNK